MADGRDAWPPEQQAPPAAVSRLTPTPIARYTFGSDPRGICPLVLGPGCEMDRFWEGADRAETASPRRGVSSAGPLKSVFRTPPPAGGAAGTDAGEMTLVGPSGGGGAIEGLRLASSGDAVQLTGSDLGNLAGLLDHEIARNTMRSYRSQWRTFRHWAIRRGVPALPAEPAHVAAYLAQRIEDLGHRPATLRAAAAAIAFVHRVTGCENPCARPEVTRTLRGATRKAGTEQKQAQGLTADAFAAIRSTACVPRRGRGGRVESAHVAERRGRLDIAVIALMRDAMLRVSEAAALTWSDVAEEPDGTGRLLIRRSKTDPEGSGAVAFVSVATMEALASIRNQALASDSVFGLQANQISKRIKRAAQVAGLGDGFSGHSPRVGMAQDLVRAGIELPSLMTAGRWRSPAMPAHYTRNETASRGAVARFYRQFRQPA